MSLQFDGGRTPEEYELDAMILGKEPSKKIAKALQIKPKEVRVRRRQMRQKARRRRPKSAQEKFTIVSFAIMITILLTAALWPALSPYFY